MMPFGHAAARNPSGVHSCCFVLILAACLHGLSVTDVVKVGDTAIITCFKACDGNLLWQFETKNEKLDVLHCVQETCTEGESFKNRVSISEKAGNRSLKLHSVLFNDEGWFKVLCDSAFLCRFHLEVFVPTTVNTTIRGNVTLPCYARTEKKIADDAVKILWKKGDQMVLQVQEGVTKYGSGFTGRASVSLQHYKDGDLSLTLFWVTTSDKGLYRCYHNTEDEHGHPGAVTLTVTAHLKSCAKEFGENLTLDLFGSDPVAVYFTGSTETLVCRVTGNDTACSPEYSHRVSVINNSLVLGGLTSSDSGTFTVKDTMGEVISINTVTVKGANKNYIYVSLAVLFGLISFCICLFLLYKCLKKSPAPAQQDHCRYNAIQSNVDINPAPLREPASIALSQQETNPEPDDGLRAPVEETTSGHVKTTVKEDNTEEEGCKLILE